MKQPSISIENELSFTVQEILKSIKEFNSTLDDSSFYISCYEVIMVNNDIQHILKLKNESNVVDFFVKMLLDFHNDYYQHFDKIKQDFNQFESFNDFFKRCDTPLYETISDAQDDIKALIDDEYINIASVILFINLNFSFSVRAYQSGLDFNTANYLTDIHKFSWILPTHKKMQVEEVAYKDFLDIAINDKFSKHGSMGGSKGVTDPELLKNIYSYHDKYLADLNLNGKRKYQLSAPKAVDKILKHFGNVPYGKDTLETYIKTHRLKNSDN